MMNKLSKSMQAIILGVVSAFFFSLTFIFNEVIANKNGFCLWSASLRYLWMMPMLALIFIPLGGSFRRVNQSIRKRPLSWWA
ncbi:MAG: hypothetical protein ACTIAH_07790 [Leuconostoc mesenteroides]